MSEYDFTRLSSSGFERLCRDVLNAKLTLQLETYPEGRDGGIDLREIRADGTTIVGQCKHYERSSKPTFIQAVKKERSKPGRAHADRYLFATTFRMNAATQTEVAKILEIPESDVWGPGRINDALRDYPEIIKNHYALWLSSTAMLERILHAELWNRTEDLLERIVDEARFWVDTPAFAEASYTLDTEGICIISGLPGTGKTFLANRLTLDAVAQEEWEVHDVLEPDEARKLWKPRIKQLFYFNDFLGENRLESDAVKQGPNLLNLIKRVRRNRADKRLVMTTRAHILREAAKSNSTALADISADPARCGVDLTAFDNWTRREILTVHLSLSRLPDDERERACASRRLLSLAEHPSYNPRLIQLVTDRARETDTGDAILKDLDRTFANPHELWSTAFQPLPSDAQEALLTLATLPSRPIELKRLRKLARFPESTTKWHNLIHTLEPTWIRLTDARLTYAGSTTVRFSNPSCRDYLLNMLDDPDHAEDCMTRIDRMDQLLTLTYESGLVLPSGECGTDPNRPHLAHALTRQGTQWSSRIENWTEEAVHPELPIANILTWLADAATLLSVFGHSESNTWLLTRVDDQLRSAFSGLPPHPAVSLARRLATVASSAARSPAEPVEQLILAALQASHTSRDLLAYEALPDDFRTKNTAALARQQAERIFGAELQMLMVSDNGADETLSEAEELQQRAAGYGLDLDLDDLVDTFADLDR